MLMAKIRNLSELQQTIVFTEFDFYQHYEETFKVSELGRIKSLLPLREMSVKYGLIEENPRSLGVKRGRKSYFSPEGKVALMFLNMYNRSVSSETDGSVKRKHPLPDILRCAYQSCKSFDELQTDRQYTVGVVRQPEGPGTAGGTCGCLEAVLKNLDTVYTDASCYGSAWRGHTG